MHPILIGCGMVGASDVNVIQEVGAFLPSKSSFDNPFLYKKRFVSKRSQLASNRHLRYRSDI